ncbi:MAG: phospholipid phosphatase [Paenibacillus sp.]|nr:phospholipid phosphatase [Paenibacillus sp.]
MPDQNAFTYRQTVVFVSLIACFAAGFSAVALLVSNHKIARFDTSIIHAVQHCETALLTQAMIYLTAIGSGWPLGIVVVLTMAVLYFLLKHRKELILLLVAASGSVLLNFTLKLLFQRARPDIHRIIVVDGYSFPSGHSMAAFSFYSIVAFLIWRHVHSRVGKGTVILLGSFFIGMIGFSRIYLGVHYPSDVLGGYFAGACWNCLLIICFRLLRLYPAG